MTEQLSRRQIEWLRDAATEFASTQMKMTMKPEEVLQLTTALLAGMDSKPVAKVETVGVCWYADNGVPRKPAVGAALYAAVPAPVMPGELHPDTQKLVADFCAALAEKLYKAQLKYGYDADWKQDGWPSQCQAHFHQHIAKGDPRDVAAYCAFMWYHGWKTKPAPVAVPDREQIRGNHAKWSQETFGNVGPLGPLKHLSKEALEAAAEPGDLSEWADMQFLLWDAQRRAGITDEQIMQAMIDKLEVNKARQWPEPKDGEPRMHIKAAPEQGE